MHAHAQKHARMHVFIYLLIYTSPRPRRKGHNRPQSHQRLRGGLGFRSPETTTLPPTDQNDTLAPLVSQASGHLAQNRASSGGNLDGRRHAHHRHYPRARGNLFIYLFIPFFSFPRSRAARAPAIHKAAELATACTSVGESPKGCGRLTEE